MSSNVHTNRRFTKAVFLLWLPLIRYLRVCYLETSVYVHLDLTANSLHIAWYVCCEAIFQKQNCHNEHTTRLGYEGCLQQAIMRS